MSFSGDVHASRDATYLQHLRLCQELCQRLRSFYANGVATKVYFLNHLRIVLCEVRRDVFAGIKLQSTTLKRKVGGISDHVALRREDKGEVGMMREDGTRWWMEREVRASPMRP